MLSKRSSGFTLIELLAVIVVLSIIAVIATPIVVQNIADAKMGSFKNSAYGIIKAAEYEQSRKVVKGEARTEVTYTYTNGVQTSNPSGNKLEFNGTKPQDGKIKINADGKVSLAIHDGTYCAEKGYNDTKVIVSEKVESSCILQE